MLVAVTLVDINPKMVAAWRETFEENPEVRIVQGSMLEQAVGAWVSPTNSRGSMDGGLDAVMKKHFGPKIEKAVQQEIGRLYGGVMPLGYATCVPTGAHQPRYLISTPTMVQSSEDVSDTLNVALGCAAAFQAVHMQNALEPGGIRSVALPGLGANTGKVPVEICADLMWTAYHLFREREFTDYVSMRAALEEILGDLTPTSGPAGGKGKAKPTAAAPKPATPPPLPPTGGVKPTPSVKPADQDFDDFG